MNSIVCNSRHVRNSPKYALEPQTQVRHKHLVIGEAAGMAQGTGRTLLRQLLTEGQVRYATVQSTSEGLSGVELPPIEGPCGLIMTTTATGLHDEDESRMLSVNVTESPEQIRAALIAQAERGQRSVEPLDTAPWFALYDRISAGPRDAFVPFAGEIAMRLPTTHDRIKRDFPHILSLIKASALLHFCSRDQEEGGRIIADIADYALVRELVNDPVSEGLGKAVPDAVRRVVEAVQSLRDKNRQRTVGLGELAEFLDREQSAVSRSVKSAVKHGYVHDLNPGQGRASELVLGDVPLPSGLILPDPAELAVIQEPDMALPVDSQDIGRLLETVN